MLNTFVWSWHIHWININSPLIRRKDFRITAYNITLSYYNMSYVKLRSIMQHLINN